MIRAKCVEFQDSDIDACERISEMNSVQDQFISSKASKTKRANRNEL